jgi:regulation of enolase protein 1 (concanavalin A-like superfamily)
MDKAGVAKMRHKECKIAIVLFLVSSFTFACGSTPAENDVPRASRKPNLAEGEKIVKPVNVSFSTYSQDWPVGWEWIDPDEKNVPTPHDTKSRVLRLRIPTGKDLAGERRNAPRYIKAITGDFQIETRVKFLPKENYQGAGLLIWADNENYLRFERAYGGIGGGAEGIRLDLLNGGEYRALVTSNEISTDEGETELRIVRLGQTFTAYWRISDKELWSRADEFVSDFPETIRAGLVACNTSEEITAEFAYIHLAPPEER